MRKKKIVWLSDTHLLPWQRKKLVHDATSHRAYTSWTPNARDGTWEKTQLKVFDKDGAVTFINRPDIISEDLTHIDGTTSLNII